MRRNLAETAGNLRERRRPGGRPEIIGQLKIFGETIDAA